MHVAITGSRGLVGSALVDALAAAGQRTTRLVRGTAQADQAHWDPARGQIDAEALEGIDALVHLAGESIAGRWTAARKQRIYQSRVDGTRLLCQTLARLKRPPATLLCASAVGYYGDRGDEVLTEKSAAGTGFLADTCRDWEAAAEPAQEAKLRVVFLRFGVVFSSDGGALPKMLVPFRLGLGGRVGSGRQYLSWITLDDVVGIILHALAAEGLAGPINVVSPQPVTNREFTKAAGRALSRPTWLPFPSLAAKILFGEMAEALLLSSARVVPLRLEENRYPFHQPTVELALRQVLGK